MELRDYLNVIRARKWIIIQAVLIVTIVAVAVSFFQAPTYEASTTVLITTDAGASLLGTSLSDLTSSPDRGLQTQVQLMLLRPRAEEVIRKLGLQESPETLLNRVTVAGVGQTNVVSITVTDRDPKRAAEIANALANSYVDASKAAKRKSIQAAIDQVQEELDSSKTQILDLGSRIAAKGKSDQLSAELTIATSLYSTLAEKLETLKVSEQLELGSGQVVSSAVADEVPVSPRPLRNGVLGLALGLVLGLGLALLFEYLDNTIKSTEEAQEIYGAPVLGHIPLERFEENEKRRLTIINHPGSPAAEAYRVIRNSLDFINFEHNIKTLLVASSTPSEGKSTVSANLAAGLAQTGQKVVLLNCDFRRPTTDQFFAVHNVIGLSDVLTGSSSLKAVLQKVGESELYVITAGKMPPNPSELLGSEKMSGIIESLKEWADWIIIDSPPLLAVADGAAIARWADGALMVSRGGVSTRDTARIGREALEKVGARILGVVVWGLDEAGTGRGGSGYAGYYGSYQYHSYYSQVPEGRGSKRGVPDSGARNVEAGRDASAAAALRGADRRSGRSIPRGVRHPHIWGIVAFVLVLVVLLASLYFADHAFGWGLVSNARALLK